jgi:hypothetical protein
MTAALMRSSNRPRSTALSLPAHEARALPERLDVLRADGAHARADAADHLIDEVGELALVRDHAFDALGHELLHVLDVALAIALLAALYHRAERAHAAHRLERAALVQDRLAGALLEAREEAAEHDRRGARGQRLDDVAAEADAPVGDHRHALGADRADHRLDRGQLRHADAGDHAGGADRARADAHLDPVDARGDKLLGGARGGHVAGHHVDRQPLLQLAHGLQDVRGVPVGGVDHQHVDARLDQPLGALVVVHADGRAHAQPPALVAQRLRVLLQLLQVLHRDQTRQAHAVVDDQELLDLVLVQPVARLLERGAGRRAHQLLAGHHPGHRRVVGGLEAAVAAGQDPDHRVALDDRQARDAVLLHDRPRLAEGGRGRKRHRVEDHAVGAALDLVDLGDLLGHAEVAVDDPDAPLARQRHGQRHLGDGVHGGRGQGDVELDVPGEAARDVDIGGHDVGAAGHQEDVVERESEARFFSGHGAGGRVSRAPGPVRPESGLAAGRWPRRGRDAWL